MTGTPTRPDTGSHERRRKVREVREQLDVLGQVEAGLLDLQMGIPKMIGQVQHAREAIASMLPQQEEAKAADASTPQNEPEEEGNGSAED